MSKIAEPSPVPTLQPAFKRAVLDRNMTVETEPFRKALEALDLSGLTILDFGCGNGNLLRLLKDTNAATIYAFEVMPDHIDADILAWAADPTAKPKLVINPEEFHLGNGAPAGDLTGYDYSLMMKSQEKFAIISNPPYFLYNRILSLTDSKKFVGALMITSSTRLHNHPDWIVRSVMTGKDFDPPAGNAQYLIQTGFAEQSLCKHDTMPAIVGAPQPFPDINNRNPKADMTDYYPEMWQQLNQLNPEIK